MLEVVDLAEAQRLVCERFSLPARTSCSVPLEEAAGRAIALDVIAEEGVPPFDRSTVDGYSVVAADTFGCSEALPALLDLAGEVEMGAEVDIACVPGTCIRIPTGGQVPAGADGVVMLEYCEEYGDGTVGVARPVAPGDNIVFKNDDVEPGQVLIDAGTVLQPHHIGTLASLGFTTCSVAEHLRVGIISTGDEIVPVDVAPVASQMRDVNAPVLAAAVEACGAQAVRFPIVPDDYEQLKATVEQALASCDLVLVSGGSSAGQKDNTARVLSELGTMLFHGIAVKPGKPTMCADVSGVPAFGLPGHPVAAYYMFIELVRPLLAQGRARTVEARLSAGIPSNHGRSEFVAVQLAGDAAGAGDAKAASSPAGATAVATASLADAEAGLRAVPVRGKSGLISQLSKADGFIVIDRNCEGLAAGARVEVRLF